MDNRYLQIDRAAYDFDNVKSGESFKFKLTQECVTPFIMFYVQTSDDARSLDKNFNNFIEVKEFELLGKNNQSTMNNVITTKDLNRELWIKHFPDRYAVQNSGSNFYEKLNLINFSLNPLEAMKGSYVGGIFLQEN